MLNVGAKEVGEFIRQKFGWWSNKHTSVAHVILWEVGRAVWIFLYNTLASFHLQDIQGAIQKQGHLAGVRWNKGEIDFLE